MKSVLVHLNVTLRVEIEEGEPEANALSEVQQIVKEALEGSFTSYEDLKIVGAIAS